LWLIFQASNIIIMNRIKEVLDEKGIKQTWLSEKLDKSYNVVNGYVQNRRQPSLDTLFRIAELLNVEPQELLSNQETKK
jgi:transcriptional regulator with XRE-family HTH domain